MDQIPWGIKLLVEFHGGEPREEPNSRDLQRGPQGISESPNDGTLISTVSDLVGQKPMSCHCHKRRMHFITGYQFHTPLQATKLRTLGNQLHCVGRCFWLGKFQMLPPNHWRVANGEATAWDGNR